jgi:hypothetical protein
MMELGWQGQVVGAISNADFDCEWAELSMGQLG